MNNAIDFNWPIRVYFEDTDAGGIVYHAQYLHFLERARTEWLRHLGFNQSELKQRNVLFVVRDMSIKWQKPAQLDDQLNVSVSIMKIKKASFIMQQNITTADEQKLRADVTIACVDALHRKPIAIPSAILECLKNKKGAQCE